MPGFSSNPFNTLPTSSAAFLTDMQTFFREEDAERYDDHFDDFIVSGGTHATAGGLTSGSFATTGYVGGYRIAQSSAAITYANATTSWVIFDADASGNLGSYIRVLGTHYLVGTGATQPAVPSDTVTLMQVVTSGGAITEVVDLRNVSPLLLGIGGINVRAFGALGDGVADDTAAIQAALTYARRIGGARVFLPHGTYKLSSAIRVGSGTELYGAGMGTILKLGAAQTDSCIENWGENLGTYDTNIVIRNLAIDGSRATPPGAFTGYEDNIWNTSTFYPTGRYLFNSITYPQRIYLCTQSGTSAASGTGPGGTGTGIVDGTCIWNFVENAWTDGSNPGGHQAGINMLRVVNVVIDNVQVYMGKDDGIIFALCYGARITNCSMRDINKNCIYFSDNEHSVCANNSMEYSFAGIAFANEFYSSMTSNVGRNCLNYFIGVGRDCQYCSITGNSGGTSLPGSAGLSSQADFLVTAESITGTTHGKTYPGAYDEYRYGIYHSTISNNTFTRMHFLMSDGNIIEGNVIHNARRDGIHLYGSSQNMVRGNRVYNGGSETIGPFAFGNLLLASSGTLQTNIESVQNHFIGNEVHDDRTNNGLVRWGFGFSGSPAYLHLDGNTVSLNSNVTAAVRFYNWNVDYGHFGKNYYANGSGPRRFILTALPTPREELRGDIVSVNGGAGVLDLHYVIQKTAADTYQAKQLTTMSPRASFTATGTGFTSSVTSTAVYEIIEYIVTITIPILTGTSNSTAFTITGIDSFALPSRTLWIPVRIADNGVDAFGLILVTASSSTLTLYPTAQSGSTWTASGTKTLYPCLIQWAAVGF